VEVGRKTDRPACVRDNNGEGITGEKSATAVGFRDRCLPEAWNSLNRDEKRWKDLSHRW